jgi:hypothetical protein
VPRRLADVLGDLRSIAEDTSSFLLRLARTADQISRLGSAAMIGTLGALIGFTVGYVVCTEMPSLAPVYMEPACTGIGLLVAVLSFRGHARLSLDKQLEENRVMHYELIQRLRSLPRNAPKSVRDELIRAIELNAAELMTIRLRGRLPLLRAPPQS